jgi:DNA-binding GntR family transcriptional regulator
LTSQSEGALRKDIVEGVFAPGQRLTNIELSDRYGVSATPLREALQRLAAENLVEIDPRLGVTVAPISRSHLQDTYRVLELLQAEAVRESVQAGDAAWEANLRTLFGEFQVAVALSQNNDGEGPPAWSRAHRAFHDGLTASCSSIWLKSMLNTLTAHSERYRILSARTGVRDPIGEHATIFAAAVARDAEGAVEAVRQHLRRTVEVVEQSILAFDDEAPPPPPPTPIHGPGPRLVGMVVQAAEGPAAKSSGP